MPSQELNLIFRLSGNAVNGLKRVNDDVKELGKSMNKMVEQASKVSASLTFLGGAVVGAFALSLRTASEYSLQTKKSLDSMNNTLIKIQVQIAEAVLPVVQRFANALSNVLQWFSALDPAMKSMVLQTALLAGAWGLFGGAIFKVIAMLMRLAQFIITANPALLAMAVAIGGVVFALTKMGVTITDVINSVELFVRMVLIGFNRVVKVVSDGAKLILTYLLQIAMGFDNARIQTELFFGAKDVTPDNMGIVRSLRVALVAVDNYGKALDDKALEIQGGMQRIFQTGQGTGTDAMGSLTSGMENLFKGGKFVEPLVKQFNMMEDIARGTAQAMSQSFSTLLFDAFSGQLKSAKEYFADFGRSILQILSQALAKMLLVKALTSFGGGFGQTLASFMHSGGQVKKAHSGYLASDEVPIVAQAGEGIISKRGMASLGSRGLAQLNGGQGGGGGATININPVIQAWDAQDVYRNRGMITAVIAESIKSNSEIRKLMKAYA